MLFADSARKRVLWACLAAAVFAVATFVTFYRLLRADLSQVTPLTNNDPGTVNLSQWDQRYAIWGIVRNARALLAPWRDFFDAGQCFPAPDSLALGHGMIALGVVGLPATFLSADPVLVYNLVLLTLTVTSPFAMYWLVTEWTELPAAGLVAGLFYGFNRAKIGAPEHLYLTDTAWTVLGLVFLRRALRSERPLLPAVAFAICMTGQLAAGVYPLIGCAFVVAIAGVGLLVENPPARRHVVPALAAAGLSALAAWAIYSPYFGLFRAGVLSERGRLFLPMSALLPHQRFFPGWLLVGLALVGAAAAVRRRPEGPPGRAVRVAALVAFVFVVFLSSGGIVTAPASPGEDLLAQMIGAVRMEAPYYFILQKIPGASVGRAPAYLYGGAHVALSLLVGMGAATVIRAALHNKRGGPRLAAITAFALCVGAALTAVRTKRFIVRTQHPSDSELNFFKTLQGDGNAGPLLELPIVDGVVWWARASEGLLVSAYHRRPTSECFTSFAGSTMPASVRSAIKDLPSGASLDAIKSAGFTTIVVHPAAGGIELQQRLLEAAVRPGSRLELLHTTPTEIAFGIR